MTCDRASLHEVSGNVSCNRQLQNVPNVNSSDMQFKVDGNGVTVGAGGSTILETKRFTVPAGKKLQIEYMGYNQINGITARVDANFYLVYDTLDAGIESYDEVELSDNSGGGTDINVDVVFYAHNPTGGSLTQPNGTFFEYRLRYVD